jgi:hypothetical protein
MVQDNRDFSIFYKNVRGIRTKCSDFIDVFANKFSIHCIMETLLNDTILRYNLFPDSYHVFRADRDYLTLNKNVEAEC